MKEIKLTQGKIALVDDDDYEKLSQNKWYVSKRRGGKCFYAVRNVPLVNKKQTIILMHREILNVPDGLSIDHKNGNGLDNRKENLRIATHSENGQNQNPHKDNRFCIKGVHWREDIKKFRAGIRFNGKVIHLGHFNVLGDADQAYRVAEIKYFGEFAREETKKLYQLG